MIKKRIFKPYQPTPDPLATMPDPVELGPIAHDVLVQYTLKDGEILKITIVERLFHIGRDKLLTIPAFASVYHYIMRWLAWLEALPPWQAVMRQVRAVQAQARAAWNRVRAWFRAVARARRSR